MFHPAPVRLMEGILKGEFDSVSEKEALALAALPENATLDLIFCAHKIRAALHPVLSLRCAIVNAKSGFCSQDCAFCAQSGHHRTGIKTWRLRSESEITAHALRMADEGATRYSMVTSGYRLDDVEMEIICRAAEKIRKKTDLLVCVSIGMIDGKTARLLLDSGVSRCHHNLETARSHFSKICTTHEYEEDIDTIKCAKEAGMEICSGGILGLGESWAQRVELAFTLKELDVDCIPLNFLNPIPGTPMEKMPLLRPMEALKSIALFRFIHPRRQITLCGGREITLGDYQSWGILAGADGLMIGNYLTTKGRSAEMDEKMIREMEGME